MIWRASKADAVAAGVLDALNIYVRALWRNQLMIEESAAIKPPIEAKDLLKVPIIRSISWVNPKWSQTPRPCFPNTPKPWASSTMIVALYLCFKRTISGKFAKSPSMENTPSTIISFTESGLHFCSCFSKSAISLCLYFNCWEKERRRPSTIEAWSRSSQMI